MSDGGSLKESGECSKHDSTPEKKQQKLFSTSPQRNYLKSRNGESLISHQNSSEGEKKLSKPKYQNLPAQLIGQMCLTLFTYLFLALKLQWSDIAPRLPYPNIMHYLLM